MLHRYNCEIDIDVSKYYGVFFYKIKQFGIGLLDRERKKQYHVPKRR
jgi:hypothetical protein